MPGIAWRLACLALGAGVLAVSPAVAQEPQAPPPPAKASRLDLYSTLEASLSATGVILNSNVRVDGEDGQGTDLDAEDDLGFDRVKAQFRGSVRWRPFRRHEFELGYQVARRTAEKTLERTITVGDSTFDVGATVHSTFDSDEAFFNYRFAFMAKERTQLGAALGLGAFFFDVGVDLRLNAAGEEAEGSVAKDVVAPIGSLGLYGRFLSGQRWRFDVDTRALWLEIDRFNIGVADLGGAVYYSLTERFALEAGYASSWIRVTVDPKPDASSQFTSGKIKYSLQSLRLGVMFTP